MLNPDRGGDRAHPRAVAKASGSRKSLARSCTETGDGECWTWSAGPSYGESTSLGGVSLKELARRTGLARNMVRSALRADAPPGFRCDAKRPSKLDPFKDEIHALLRRDPKLPGVRVRELIEPLA